MKEDWTGEWQPNNMTTVSYIVTRIVIYIIANIWNFSNLRQAFPYGKKYHVDSALCQVEPYLGLISHRLSHQSFPYLFKNRRGKMTHKSV